MAASQREIADERWLRVGLVLWRSACGKGENRTDTLQVSHALEDSGFSTAQAEAMTNALKAAVETDVVTKAALQELKADMYKAMVSQTVILLGFVFAMLKFM